MKTNYCQIEAFFNGGHWLWFSTIVFLNWRTSCHECTLFLSRNPSPLTQISCLCYSDLFFSFFAFFSLTFCFSSAAFFSSRKLKSRSMLTCWKQERRNLGMLTQRRREKPYLAYCEHLSDMSLSALEKHSVTEFAPPQLFLCANRSLIRYDFRDGEKAIWHSVKIALQLHRSTVRV